MAAVANDPPPGAINVTVRHLTFNSAFDSGNLASVAYDNGVFLLSTWKDAHGTLGENSNATWFHFKVTGAKRGETVKFRIVNMNSQGKVQRAVWPCEWNTHRVVGSFYVFF